MHEITVPAAMAVAEGVPTVRMRLVVDKLAVPAVRPVHVRADVGLTVVSKLTPATVIALIAPAVVVVKETVADTDVAVFAFLSRTIEAAAKAALYIGG